MSFEKNPPPLLDESSERLLAQTPLHFACYAGDGHLLDTHIGNTLLYNNNCGHAAESCVAVLISEEDSINGWTPAHWAAFYGHLSCLMKLNVCQSLGFDTPSHRSNTSPLHLSAQSGSCLCLKWLLQSGSSTDRQDFMGETALHKAAKSGNLNCVTMLVNHGASLEIKNHRGLTPAELAAQSDHTSVVEHLRQATEEEQGSNMRKWASVPCPVSVLGDSATLNLIPKQHSSIYTTHPVLTKEDETLRQSYIFMNGEIIHNRFSAESCDMDQAESGMILQSSGSEDCNMSSSSWNKKRSFDDIEDDNLHSYKRKCFVPASQKGHEGRYGDAYNNNVISSYSAVLAMQVEPVSHKTSSDSLDGAGKPTSPVLQQSSLMEHEASVVAQQGYDSTFMNTVSNAFC